MSVQGFDSVPRIDQIPGVRVRKLGSDRGRRKVRQVVVDQAVPTPGVVFTHNNSLSNVMRGLGERLKFVSDGHGGFIPPPRPTVFDLEEYGERLLRKMPKFDAPISRDEFVLLYNGAKQKRYAQAVIQLERDGLQERDSEVSTFIKDEKVCSWLKEDPAPRLISPRDPKYGVELGRYIKPIEHLLYKAVARVWGETTIAKGLNFNDRGKLMADKWHSFEDPVAVGLDASRFDQHVSPEALAWEHSVYRGCYPRERRSGTLARLLRRQINNVGRCYVDDHEVKWEHRGGRMSGDMNTALGNCLIMTGLVWKYLKDRGIGGKLINDGDDCVVFLERRDLVHFTNGLEEWFRARGFTMKVERPVDKLEQIEFCQCHPVWNGEQYTMCRNVHKALFTDAVHIGRTVEEIRSIRAATSLCGKVWSRGLPVFGAFYDFIDCQVDPRYKARFHGDFLHSGTAWQSKGCCTGTQEVTSAARDSFAIAFGVEASEQEAIEDFYGRLKRPVLDAPHNALVYNPSEPANNYPLFVCESLNLCLSVYNK